MTDATNAKVTAKQKLINQIIAFNAGYGQESCNAMKVPELKELLQELKLEAVTPEPELNAETGALIVHEPTVQLPTPPQKREKKEGGSKRDVLYAAFDAAQAAGEDLKAAAHAASPETSKGVVSSYLCYWRKDRGVVATRGFGNTAEKKTKEAKVLALIAKLYGVNYNFDATIEAITATREAELQAAGGE